MVVLPPVFSSVPRPGRRRAPPTRPLLHLQVSSRSPNTLRLTDSRGRREAGEGGARASDLRELSRFEKINFFPQKKFGNSFIMKVEALLPNKLEPGVHL